MAVTASHLEKAYDKLVRWCSSEFRSMGRDASLEVSNELSEAARRLRSRPELLACATSPTTSPLLTHVNRPPLSSEALTVLAQTRQAATLSSFMGALTTGSTTSRAGARPIELHAHDALRYIGDMLAWVHQAIAAEREFLETLLGIDAGARMPGAVRAPAHAADEWLGELLDAAVAGLCGPLRSRVLQTVRAQESALSAYKVARLLQFYALTMSRTLGARALLATTLGEYVATPSLHLLSCSPLHLSPIVIGRPPRRMPSFSTPSLRRVALCYASRSTRPTRRSRRPRHSSRTPKTYAPSSRCTPPRLMTTPVPAGRAKVRRSSARWTRSSTPRCRCASTLQRRRTRRSDAVALLRLP